MSKTTFIFCRRWYRSLS